ncbi:MAG: cytochrome c oxidase accessory protein CcoG [Bacteroidota bacterium]
MSNFNIENDDFRNHLYNQTKDGKRLWIYPGRVIGQLYKLRSYFSYLLLTLLFGLPWLEHKGQPIFLFNVIERKFIFWGVPFFPQDFHLVALGLVSFLIFISLFTVLFGRIWCGWACPQTIFMEMLFRKIEYWIEGDDKAQRRLNESPWTNEKILKKGSKHTLFVLLAFAISNTFLMYLIGKQEWLQIVMGNPIEHITGLAAMLIFTAVFYFVFARFREMVCMVICPYGRLQGVLLDNNSILVQYDHVRGEPRGKVSKTASRGDCIDCHWCVRVCPTGIDIRNGSNQLECIGCTACIDACDAVMEKIDKPQGLIRYDSLNGVNSGTKLKFTTRIVAYSGVLVLILGILVFMLATRKNWETTLLRTPGMTFQVDEKLHTVSNIYNLAILNKSMDDQQFSVHVDKPLELIWIGKGIGKIEKGKQIKSEFFIKTKIGAWKQGEKIPIHIQNDQGKEETLKTSFIQPDE